MVSQMEVFESVSNYILSKIDIHVSGACGPECAQPIECYYPVHQAYSACVSKKHAPIDHAMAAIIPGGVPRPVKSMAARKGYGLVYDRDIVTTWRLPNTASAYEVFFWEKEFERALGRNTMFVVLEAFYDEHPEICKPYGACTNNIQLTIWRQTTAMRSTSCRDSGPMWKVWALRWCPSPPLALCPTWSIASSA